MTKRQRIRYDSQNDLYDVLDVSPLATIDEIQQAFRRRAKEVHPDRNPERVAWATAQFRLLNDAYDLLSDPLARADYDRQRQRVFPRTYDSVRDSAPSPSVKAARDYNSDWWNRSNFGTADGSRAGAASEPLRWPSKTPPHNYRAAVMRGITHGPYRYIVAILGLVFLANFAFFTMADQRLAEAARANLILTARAGGSRASPVFIVGKLPPLGESDAPEPTCDNPNVTISKPHDGDELNFEAFDISGSAYDDQFTTYMLEIESLSELQRSGTGPTSWILQMPVHQAVQDGLLVKGASIANVGTGVYLLRLTVSRSDGSILPPCEITIRRKP